MKNKLVDSFKILSMAFLLFALCIADFISPFIFLFIIVKLIL